MENYSDKNNLYLTSDIKLQAFLRLVLPNSFIGLNKTNINKVNFVFRKNKELTDFVNGYLGRQQYLISPLAFAENIELGKGLVHGDY